MRLLFYCKTLTLCVKFKSMKQNYGFLSGNALKIIALVTMTLDHIGYILLPEIVWLRIIGRIAFPVFAYLIAEGCKYTKNKLKYFLLIFLLGLFCQVFAYCFAGQTKLNILLTFSFSIALIYLLNWIKTSIKNANKKHIAISVILFVLSLVATFLLTSNSLSFSPISVDYGFWGIMVAVLVSVFDNHYLKAVLFAIALILVSLNYSIIQWFSLVSVALVLWYNGKRGKYNLKYLFYVYYPLHLAVIYLLKLII